MGIREALEALSGFLDNLSMHGEYSEEELAHISAVENAIYTYVQNKGDIE